MQITDSEIKQYAGRAGRFTNVGRVTSFRARDLPIIRKALQSVAKVDKDVSKKISRVDFGAKTFHKDLNLIRSMKFNLKKSHDQLFSS